jgi:hypothetical protein
MSNRKLTVSLEWRTTAIGTASMARIRRVSLARGRGPRGSHGWTLGQAFGRDEIDVTKGLRSAFERRPPLFSFES